MLSGYDKHLIQIMLIIVEKFCPSGQLLSDGYVYMNQNKWTTSQSLSNGYPKNIAAL